MVSGDGRDEERIGEGNEKGRGVSEHSEKPCVYCGLGHGAHCHEVGRKFHACRVEDGWHPVWRFTPEPQPANVAASLINSPGCLFAGPGRGDCEHFVGLPGELVDGHNTDTYGKPNGWCWYCWLSYRTHKAEKRCAELERSIQERIADIDKRLRHLEQDIALVTPAKPQELLRQIIEGRGKAI